MKNTIKIEYMLLILIIGMFSAIIFHYSRFAFIGNHSPFLDTFLHNSVNIFCDYYYLNNVYFLNKYAAVINYFPSTFIILDILQRLTESNPYRSIQILLIIYLSSLSFLVFKLLHHFELRIRILSTFALLFCNYPVIFALHTGNFEIICFIFVAYGLVFGLNRKYTSAAILIGAAASIKAYPIIFILVFINKDNFIKVCFFSFISILVLTCLGFMMQGNFIDNLHTYIGNMGAGFKFYKEIMIGSVSGVHFGHSLLNSLQIIYPPLNVQKYIPYTSLLGVILLIFAAYNSFKSTNIIIKILLPLCVICLFPPTSSDYKLIYFTLPLLLLLRSNECSKNTVHTIVWICLLLIPKDYKYWHKDIYQNLNSILNTLIIIKLFTSSALTVLKSKSLK
jgi:hypothetical protein